MARRKQVELTDAEKRRLFLENEKAAYEARTGETVWLEHYGLDEDAAETEPQTEPEREGEPE